MGWALNSCARTKPSAVAARRAHHQRRPQFTAGFPSTTAASIGSIGTGLPPGAHGILGYQVMIPGTTD